MENLTHTLVGAALADAALRPAAPAATRRLFLAAGVVAANAPDLDLLYTAITPMPIGYLLHHRGHTHTALGLLAQMAVLGLACAALPMARAMAAADRARLAIVLAAGLLSHLLLDAGNSYGVHPFWPLDNRWYFGDALFIFEPWLLVLLGVALALNARSRVGRIVMAATVVLPVVAVTIIGFVPWVAFVSLAAGAVIWTAIAGPRSVPWRALAALALCAVLGLGMFAMSRVARAAVLAEIAAGPAGRVLDVILTPSPAVPLCYLVIVIQRDEAADRLLTQRGAVSLTPMTCPFFESVKARTPRAGATGRMVWSDEREQSIGALRSLSSSDCRVRAWLQFGRAPIVEAGRMFDLRFENLGAGNFSAMTIDPRGGSWSCPPYVPPWGTPRADVVGPARP